MFSVILHPIEHSIDQKCKYKEIRGKVVSSTRWGFAQKERERKGGEKGQAFKIHLYLGLYVRCHGKLKDKTRSLASRNLRQDLPKGSKVPRKRLFAVCLYKNGLI